jgi:hypothetical protein
MRLHRRRPLGEQNGHDGWLQDQQKHQPTILRLNVQSFSEPILCSGIWLQQSFHPAAKNDQSTYPMPNPAERRQQKPARTSVRQQSKPISPL